MIGHFIVTEVGRGVILCQFFELTVSEHAAKIDRFLFLL